MDRPLEVDKDHEEPSQHAKTDGQLARDEQDTTTTTWVLDCQDCGLWATFKRPETATQWRDYHTEITGHEMAMDSQ